jgi:SAM-dependent methyltransferase
VNIFSILLFLFSNYFFASLKAVKKIPYVHASFFYMEILDLPDSAYDAVLCRWGLLLLPNLGAALSKIHDSLISGGRFAAAVWADAPKVPIISLAERIISEQLRMPLPPAGVPNPFSLADIKKLENHLVKAGFSDVQVETVSLFKIKDQDRGGSPRHAYLLTKLIKTKKVLVRKLPVIGMRDWLLIYEDTLLELSKRRL